MKQYYKRETCRLCKSSKLEHVMHVASTPVGDDFIPSNRLDKIQNEYPLDLCFCAECGLLQLPGVIDPEIIYSEYLYETSISLGLARHFQHYGEDLLRRINPVKGSLVIDIGSNDGTLLKLFQSQGMNVMGIEPAQELAKKVTASGIETLPNYFTADFAHELKKSRGPAAIVTANNVFANIDDLDDFAEGIRELLSPEGVFVFETGYMIDTIQNTVIDNIYHEHLCYFSIKPLVKFFDKYGLEIIDVQRIPTKGGSIRGTVQLKGANRKISPSVPGLIALETELGFDRITPFKEFVKRVESVKRDLNIMLCDLQKQKKTIAGYGASVGGTTLLYYFSLKNILEFIFDDNPAKHHLFSPGLKIPVLPSESIYEKKPDYVLVFGWRYAKPIIKKHEKYLAQGGHFILPFPGVEVI